LLRHIVVGACSCDKHVGLFQNELLAQKRFLFFFHLNLNVSITSLGLATWQGCTAGWCTVENQVLHVSGVAPVA
jgi:hypothetical protein